MKGSTDESKLVTAKAEDLLKLCDKYSCARFSDFLDEAAICVINDTVLPVYGYKVMFYGGYDDAERKIMGVFPEWEEPAKESFPLKILKFAGGFNRTLTHRDYLGTLMSLGIDRSKFGDIVVDGAAAFVMLTDEIADYVRENISKVGNQGIKITEAGTFDIPERKYKRISAVCASLRLDALVGAAANVSRSSAGEMIRNGNIKVNHRPIYDLSAAVKAGDLLSVRGYGRYILAEVGEETRSGRIHIGFDKYI